MWCLFRYWCFGGVQQSKNWSRPGLGYAFFPCGVGVALLLITTRLVTFLMAHPLWKMKKVAKSYRAARMMLLRHEN